MFLSEEYVHSNHSGNYRCMCGEECGTKSAWERHVNRALVKQILIDHQQIPGSHDCITCGIVGYGISFVSHVINVIEKEGFTIERPVRDATAEA